MADGIVEHGYGNCNSCTFHIDANGTMTMDGTPTVGPGPNNSTAKYYTASLTADFNQTFNPTPGIVDGKSLNSIVVRGVRTDTKQVSITWTIQYPNVAQSIEVDSPLNQN